MDGTGRPVVPAPSPADAGLSVGDSDVAGDASLDAAERVYTVDDDLEPEPPDPTVDPELADWVARLVAREPEARTRSAATAAAELEDIALETLGPRWRASAPLVPKLDDLQQVARLRATAPRTAPALAATLPPTRRPTGPTVPAGPG